jgi:hypothetical protein
MNSRNPVARRWSKFVSVCLLTIFCAFAQHGFVQSATNSAPDANPGRPTVSTPATLTPVGYLQFENGTLFAEHSVEFSQRFGTSQVTKLTVLSRLELFLQSEPLAISQSEAKTTIHEGEVFVGTQGILFDGGESRPTVSVSYTRRVHVSAAPELDIGTFQQSGLILLSDDVRGCHVDTNGIVAEQTQGAVRRAQFGQTLSISHPLGHFHDFRGDLAVLATLRARQCCRDLWAISYSLRKNLVVDGGFDHGLTKTSTHWETFVGFYALTATSFVDGSSFEATVTAPSLQSSRQ